MSSKISQAISYQKPVAISFIKSESKRKIDEVQKDDIDIFIDDEASAIIKKSKYHCEYCDCTFQNSNQFAQHKRSQKHNKAL